MDLDHKLDQAGHGKGGGLGSVQGTTPRFNKCASVQSNLRVTLK